MQGGVRLAFDVGGTFTDFVLEDEATGAVAFGKELTTPRDVAAGVLAGLAALLARHRVADGDVREIVHATTVAANAILERRGPRTALVTTEGFRDVVLIGRQKRYETYDLSIDKPAPLVRRRDVVEVAERTGPDGEAELPLTDDAVARAVEDLGAVEGLRAAAVCLLHSYADPSHERRLGAAIAERLPHVMVSLSSDVSPRRGEYERTSTTVADAYVKPIVHGYLHRLLGELGARGIHGRFFVMQSNGGLSTPELAATHPIRIVESGPAAGVLMAADLGRRSGRDRLLTFDMGGTTAKIGAVADGEPAVTDAFEIDAVNYRKGSGLPLTVPVIELIEIGAGGGSVAGLRMGTLAVGPESAGSEPGPVCYGRGGTRVTVTDANLVLGYLDPGYFLGGAMPLDADAARRALEEQVARPLELDPGRAAWGVHTVANTGMERALRVMSIERGRDPRSHCLVAFGGAGPLHAARLARALAIPEVLVPPGAGVGSALGLLAAPLRFDLTMTRPLPVDAGAGAAIRRALGDVRARLAGDYRLPPDAEVTWSYGVKMRYRGQGHEILVPLPAGVEGSAAAAVVAAFQDAYRRTYGYVQEDQPVEVVDWTATALVGGADRSRVPAAPASGGGGGRKGERAAYFPEAGGFAPCPVWERDGLGEGARVAGPAIVEERESTTVVPPGDAARVDAHGNLVIEIGGHG